jgi:hypothetical protein
MPSRVGDAMLCRTEQERKKNNKKARRIKSVRERYGT